MPSTTMDSDGGERIVRSPGGGEVDVTSMDPGNGKEETREWAGVRHGRYH